MPKLNGNVFGRGDPRFEDVFIKDYKKLKDIVRALRELGARIVATSGSFDLFHVGHANYLYQAKQHGDILIVGVDSDKKIRARKGPHRPVVKEGERLRILFYHRSPTYLVLKGHKDPKLHFLKAVRPDVLVVSETTGHEDGSLASMRRYCGKIVVLPPQAQTSTTARVRNLFMEGAKEIKQALDEELPVMVDRVFERVRQGAR